MRTGYADRGNTTYKCVLGNPEKGYRRSRNQSNSGANLPASKPHQVSPILSPFSVRKSCKVFLVSLFIDPHTLTADQIAADAARNGLTDITTSVSFHP